MQRDSLLDKERRKQAPFYSYLGIKFLGEEKFIYEVTDAIFIGSLINHQTCILTAKIIGLILA